MRHRCYRQQPPLLKFVTTRKISSHLEVPNHNLVLSKTSEEGKIQKPAGGKDPQTVKEVKYCLAQTRQTSDKPKRASTTGQRRQTILTGDYMLKSMDRTFWKWQKDSRTVFCLPVEKRKDITTRIKKILRSAEETPFALIHMGTIPQILENFREL